MCHTEDVALSSLPWLDDSHTSVETQSTIIAITRLHPGQIVQIHKHGLPKRSRCMIQERWRCS
jgi:hypothetical protein